MSTPNPINNYFNLREHIDYRWRTPNVFDDKSQSADQFEWADPLNSGNKLYIAGEPWRLGLMLGSGNYAKVYLAIRESKSSDPFDTLLKEGNILVVKLYTNPRYFENDRAAFKIYYDAYQSFYPEALQSLVIEDIAQSSTMGYQAFLVLPLFIGNLEYLVEEPFRGTINSDSTAQLFSPVRALTACIAVLKALDFFHRQTNCAHLDIKLGNIQYDELSEKAAVIDPDMLSRVAEASQLSCRNNIRGSLGYQGPEVHIEKGFNFTTDYYALAAILIALLGTKKSSILQNKQKMSNLKRSKYEISQAPYNINPLNMRKHFNPDEFTTLVTQINKLCDSDWRKRPQSLLESIECFESVLNQWLARHRSSHQGKLKSVHADLHHFFKQENLHSETLSADSSCTVTPN